MKRTLLQPPEEWPELARELYSEFVQEKERKNLSARACLLYLQRFLRFQASQGLSYRDYPPSAWNDYRETLTPDNQRQCWRGLRSWLKFLYARQELLGAVHDQLIPPFRFRRRFRRILSYEEVLRLLQMPDLDSPQGLRDRAMLEVTYSGGLRTGELFHLDLHDVDLAGNSVTLRWTKNRRDRVVPLGKWAIHSLKCYLNDGRPPMQKASPLSSPALWLGCQGRRLQPIVFYQRMRSYDEKLGFRFTPYLLRHACATHLLQQGASLRLVQELLGHQSLQSTGHYTRVTPIHLQRVHRLHHPRNRPDFGPERAEWKESQVDFSALQAHNQADF